MKPEYPKNRKTRRVSRDCRLLNIHLWNLADDEGRLQELPQWIIGEVFPEDEDVTPVVLREWLGSLHNAGLIQRYEVDGERYIQCHDFNDHQVINKPKPSEIPAPQAESDQSRTPTVDLPEDSRPERKGKEGKGTGNGSPKGAPNLSEQVWSILKGGVDSLSENDQGRPWPDPVLGKLALAIGATEPEVALRVAREVREIVQSQDRAPNVTSLYEQKLRQA